MQELIKSVEAVVDFLRNVPLNGSTVTDYQSRYRSILAYCESNNIFYFSKYEAQVFISIQKARCKNGYIGERQFRRLRRCASLLAAYTEGEELVWESAVFPAKTLCEYYVNVLVDYKTYLYPFLAPNTILGVLSRIRQFLFFLESEGIYDLTFLTADFVKHYLQSVGEKNKNSMGDLIWSMRQFILFINETNLSSVKADKYLLRPASNRKKVLPCFTGKEIDAILFTPDTATELGKRDYAILILAIKTGLRVTDILNLKLTDTNWRKCEITVVQNKTGEAIHLPLLVDVGNAIADYILHTRPKSSSPYIFLRTIRPYKKLNNLGNGKNIISRYLAKAGIQHESWDGKTFHAFRRSQGTRLIEAEVPLPDVADLLGHKALDSTKRYISQNDDKLRVCCLDISEYVSRKEGLE